MKGEPSRAPGAPGRRLSIVASGNVLRAYSGLLYLAEALQDNGLSVDLTGPIPPGHLREAAYLSIPLRTIFARRSIPRSLAVRAFRARLLISGLVRPRSWLFSDLTFFREAVTLRRSGRARTLVHYCPEFLTPEEFPEVPHTSAYAQSAHVPDLTVDVDPNRARLRQQRFNLAHTPLVLPNTIPLRELEQLPTGIRLSKVAGLDVAPSRPVLLYAGGLHRGTGLATVIDALAGLGDRDFLFVAFCHTEDDRRFRAFRESASVALGDRAKVCRAVPRRHLLAVLPEADAAFVYYPENELPTTNQRYCAPTKLYESIARGVPVIASPNPPLRSLLLENDVGMCAVDESAGALRDVVRQVLSADSWRRDVKARAPRFFARELSFEKLSAETVQAISQLVKR